MSNPKVLLVTSNEEISGCVTDELQKNHCIVDKITLEKVEKKIKSGIFAEANYNYVIVIDLTKKESAGRKDIESKDYCLSMLRIANESRVKTVFIFPYFNSPKQSTQYLNLGKDILKDKDTLSMVIYVGEIIHGSRVITEGGPFSKLIDSLRIGNSVKIEKGDKYYLPIELKAFAEIILKKLFSISSFGKSAVIITKPANQKRVEQRILKTFTDYKIELVEQSKNALGDIKKEFYKSTSNEREKSTVNIIDELIRGGKKVDSRLPSMRVVEKPENETNYEKPKVSQNPIKTKIKKIKIDKKILKRRFWKLTLMVLVILVAPFFLLLINLTLYKLTLNIANKGYLNQANKSVLFAKYLSDFTKTYSGLFKDSLLFEYSHSGIFRISGYFSDRLDITKESLYIKTDLIRGADIILSGDSVGINGFFERTGLDINHLKKHVDFFRSETKELSNLSGLLVSKLLNIEKLSENGKLEDYGELVSLFPLALGNEGKTKYIVVMQNDEVVRASGGLLESLLIVTFENGKLWKIETYGVDHLDRKLVGVIEPPLPLTKYFNVSNWYLRDSNWFADFTSSAQKIEWFVDKELDEQVDGVVAVNYKVLKEALEIYDEIIVEDEFAIDIENIDVLLNTIEYENYPDDRKRGDLSAVILKSMIEETYGMKQRSKSRLIDLLHESLEAGDIQVYLHNNRLGKVISDIGWDGSFNVGSCIENCYEDYLKIIESELIESSKILTNKSANLDISIEDSVIRRKLTVFIENLGSNGVGGDLYKSYLRVLVPSDAGVGLVEYVSKDERKKEEAQVFGMKGNKEMGSYVELKAGEAIAVIYSWESGTDLDTNEEGEYGIKWFKQSGTENYPVEIKVVVNSQNMEFSSTNLNLTEENRFGYNTNLSRDNVSRVFWKNGFKN